MARLADELQLSYIENRISISHPRYGWIIELPLSDEDKDDDYKSIKERAIQLWITATTERADQYLAENGENLQIRDDTYMDGSLCRVDYGIRTPEGQANLLKIKTEYPDVEIDEDDDKVLLTIYSSERYANEIFGIYQWHEISDDMKTKYKLDYSEYDVFSTDLEKGLNEYQVSTSPFGLNRAIGSSSKWYGLKIDRTTDHAQLKCVIPEHVIDESILEKLHASFPTYYLTNRFCATLHNEDGTISPQIDWYFTTNAESMKEWCVMNSMPFPYPEEMMDELENKTMCFGIVYDKDEDKFKHVKAYIRNYI